MRGSRSNTSLSASPTVAPSTTASGQLTCRCRFEVKTTRAMAGMIRGIMTMKPWRDLARFCMAVVHRFYEDRSSQTAGSLTYTSLLALVPLLTVALTVSTALPLFDRMVEALQDFVLDNFLPDTPAVDMFATQLNDFTERAGQLRAIGLATLGVTALMTMHTIDDSLNRIFRVAQQRLLLKRIVMYI